MIVCFMLDDDIDVIINLLFESTHEMIHLLEEDKQKGKAFHVTNDLLSTSSN